jgi:hypothetical protein
VRVATLTGMPPLPLTRSSHLHSRASCSCSSRRIA